MFTRHALGLSTLVVLLAACGGDSTGPSGPSGPPVLTSINGATAPSGPVGSTVSVEGQNFGDTQGSSQVLFSDGAGGTIPAVIASAGDWTSTFILTTVPAGAATGEVVVQTSLGTSNALVFTVTDAAVFSPSTISWTSTSSLPAALSGLATGFARIEATSSTARAIYAVGGADATNTPVSTVYYATVGGSGTLSGWTATASLPVGLAFHGLTVATPGNSRVTAAGHLFVVGGATDAAGTPGAIVYRGDLAADGSVTGWSQVAALPLPLHSMGAVIFQGDLYVFGGSTTGNAPVATVYRSRIEAAGTLGAWQSQAALPFARSYFGYGTFGGYLYTFGGDSGTVAPNHGSLTTSTIADVAYARIDLRTRDLTTAGWTTNASTLTKATSKQTAVVAGGNVLLTAGLYNGASTGSTEQTYAQLNADGSVGSFSGATGANTIVSLGGGNLFNHSATGYTDGSGVFHVLVAGGDDVNSPGSKRSGVWFY